MVTNGNTNKSLESWIWDAACSICGAKAFKLVKHDKMPVHQLNLEETLLEPTGQGLNEVLPHTVSKLFKERKVVHNSIRSMSPYRFDISKGAQLR